MSSKKAIHVTTNYRLFNKSSDNRPLDPKKHKRLYESMQKYGFIPDYPVIAIRAADGNLELKEGQHRLQAAESLGLPVYWTETKIDFDIGLVNDTQKPWQTIDYARKHASNGLKVYQDGIDFAEQYKIPIGTAFALLGGTTSFGNVEPQYKSGTFKIKDKPYADMVATVYSSISNMSSAGIKKQTFIEACMKVCRVSGFDPKRLISGAELCREKLVNYGTCDGFLTMLEEVYNFKRFAKNLFPLKLQAIATMRDRNATKVAADKKKQKAAA